MKPAVVTAHAKNQQKTAGRPLPAKQRECLELRDLAECLLDAYESVTCRAHEKYIARGATPGQDFEDWVDAERELLADVQTDFADSERFVYALASLPEFAGSEISVAVEPRWLLIMARSEGDETSGIGASEGDAAQRQRFSIFELGAHVERSGTVAVLSQGLLAIRMPKSPKF